MSWKSIVKLYSTHTRATSGRSIRTVTMVGRLLEMFTSGNDGVLSTDERSNPSSSQVDLSHSELNVPIDGNTINNDRHEELKHVPDHGERQSLGSCLGRALKNHTWGSLSVDLKRSHILDDAFEDAAEESLIEADDETNPFLVGGTTRRVDTGMPRQRFSTHGARCKVMRHVSLGPRVSSTVHGRTLDAKAIDVGVGLSFELDSARFRPKARVRVLRTVSLGLFPCPHVKIQRRIPIGLTGFSLRASYFCPCTDIHRFYRRPARFIVTMDDDQNYGMRLSHAGVEMAGNTWIDWYKGGYVQASALVHLPQSVDFQGDGDHGFVVPRVEPMRCGLKMAW